MELQFEIECKVCKAYFVDAFTEEVIDTLVHNDSPVTLINHGKYNNLTFCLSNDNIEEILLEIINEQAFFIDPLHITHVSVLNKIIKFDVSVAVPFYKYNPDMLHGLVDLYEGKIKGMSVNNSSTINGKETITFSISPFSNDFTKVVDILERYFDVSIELGNMKKWHIISGRRQRVNDIIVHAQFKKSNKERITEQLSKLVQA